MADLEQTTAAPAEATNPIPLEIDSSTSQDTTTPPSTTTSGTMRHNDDVEDDDEDTSQGAKCCGCCCDYRRAVIIVNFISLIFGCVGMVSYFGSTVFTLLMEGYEDTVITFGRINGILTAIGMSFGVLAIIGAYQYNTIMISVVIGWNVLHIILRGILNQITSASIQRDFEQAQIQKYGQIKEEYHARNFLPDLIIGIVSAILLIYPHAGFIYEVQKGILSRETYAREEYSCCCTKR